MTDQADTPDPIGGRRSLCGAQAWRTFTVEGWISTTVHTTADVRCGLSAGHDGQHAGWLGFHTGRRGLANAKVTW